VDLNQVVDITWPFYTRTVGPHFREEPDIQGKALFIYWSDDRNRIGKQLR
jgi:hypothetical protein